MHNPARVAPWRGRFFASAFNFLYYGGLAGLYPYLTLYYEQLGLTGSQIGLLAGLPPILTLVSSPFWTGLADASGRHRLVMSVGIFGAVGSTLLLMQAEQLGWLAVGIIGFAFFASTIVPLVDNATLDMLGGEKSQYGKVRLWASIGWGGTSPLIGRLIDLSGIRAGFSVYIGLVLVGFLISFGLQYAPRQSSTPFRHGVRQLLSDRRWISFLALAGVGGMCIAVINGYLLLLMNSLGANKTLMGLVMMVATMSEIPTLFFLDRLLRRWSAQRLLAFSIAVYVLRAWMTSLVRVPWLMLPLQLLHGPSYALLMGSGVSLADEIAPQGLGATGQGLFTATTMGVGAAAGAMLGGWLYQYLGAPAVFQVIGGVAFLVLLVWLTLGQGLKET